MTMSEIIRSRAPMRIGLAGGGTDVNPYASEKGGYVFNTTVNKYAYSMLKARDDHVMRVTSEYYGRYQAPLDGGPLPLDGNMDLIKSVTNHFGITDGFEISISSDVPAGSGLGGSSTMIVSMIGAVANWLDIDISKMEMAALAYHLEREVIGLSGGKQDQYAAVFGGFNSFKIDANGVNVLPAKIHPDIVHELQCRSVMCFTGMTHDSATIIDTQVKSYKEGKNDAALDHSKTIAVQIRQALRHGNITEVGKLLGEAWEYKKQFSNKISNPVIDDLYNTAIEAGAVGGKVSGAGGGGFMYFVCDYDKKANVSRALTSKGASVSEFSYEPEGVISWRSKI